MTRQVPFHEEELSALLTSSQAILEHREFKDAARAIFDACKGLIGAAAGYVALLSEGEDENILLFLDAGGLPCAVDPSLPMPIRGLRAEAYRSGKVVWENDFSSSRWMEFLPPGHVAMESVLFAPLSVGGKTVGLLGLANKPGGFSERDAALATAFGRHVAIALANSHTLESLEVSREHFRSLVDAANEAIVSADRGGRIIGWNRAAELMFGYAAADIMGRPLNVIMPAGSRQAHEEGMRRVVQTGESGMVGRTVEKVALRADGSEVPVELSLARWETKRGVFFTGIVRDISARREAERKLRESEERLRAIFDTSRDLMAILDAGGRVRWLNTVAQETFGYTPENIGDPFEMIHPLDRERVGATWKAIIEEGGAADRIAYRCRGAGGEYRYLESAVRRITVAGESLLLVVSQDTTELVKLRRQVTAPRGVAGIVGHDPGMLRLLETIHEVAQSDAPVLIQGESGTGKELVAAAIHQGGPRAEKNFIAVNCAALPDTLLESELFGHVKGAFTGAYRDKKGRFELADGGTIFLDEVADVSPSMQVKLLRVLQEGAFERLGSEKTTRVDVRVISATNRDLAKEVAAGHFREDLYYRLSVVPLTVPPLRERVNDIPLLANHILAEEQRRTERRKDPGRPARGVTVSPRALAILIAHPWQGNVRELQNVLRYALIKCKGDVIGPEHLPPMLTRGENRAVSLDLKVRRGRLTAANVAEALEKSGGHRGRAARLLGVSRATFYRFLASKRPPAAEK